MKTIRITVDPDTLSLRVQSNMGFAETIAGLEAAKFNLIANASRAPEGPKNEEGQRTPDLTVPAPEFAPRTVA